MTLVRIPAPLQHYSGGRETLEVEAGNVRKLVAALEEQCPGLREALMNGDKLKPDVAVAIDGVVNQLGALASTETAKEVIFIPAVGGG